MLKNMISELTTGSLEAYLSKRMYDEFYFKTAFPIKKCGSLHFRTIVGGGGATVAADVISYSASSPVKTRQVVKKLSGDIPKSSMKVTMSEEDLNEYLALKNLNSSSVKDVLELIYGYVEKTQKGVHGRAEWLCFQCLSKGSITLDSTTNGAGIVTETDIDFQRLAARKEYIGSAGGTAATTHYWTAAAKATNDPILDIESIVNEGAAIGINLKYLWMSRAKYIEFAQSAAVREFGSNVVINANAVAPRVTRKRLNELFEDIGLPKIIVVDSMIDSEDEDHTATSHSCFDNDYVTFTETRSPGRLMMGPIAEEEFSEYTGEVSV